jgi:hypothetical protein
MTTPTRREPGTMKLTANTTVSVDDWHRDPHTPIKDAGKENA